MREKNPQIELPNVAVKSLVTAYCRSDLESADGVGEKARLTYPRYLPVSASIFHRTLCMIQAISSPTIAFTAAALTR